MFWENAIFNKSNFMAWTVRVEANMSKHHIRWEMLNWVSECKQWDKHYPLARVWTYIHDFLEKNCLF